MEKRRQENRASYYRNRENRLRGHAAYRDRTHERWLEHDRIRNKDKERTQRHNHSRRAHLVGAFEEDVSLVVVFARDEEHCGVCIAPVSWADATLDHVIPLSRGGKHGYANVQLAHRWCNTAKNRKTPGELDARFFGRMSKRWGRVVMGEEVFV